jgi:hypothetical protein
MRNEAVHPAPSACRVPPIFSVIAIRGVAPELTAIAARLRSEHADLRGVAAAERMLLDGTSPLYRDDVDGLREELHRVRYLLG